MKYGLDLGLLVLRVIPALLMAVRHGWPKLLRFFGEGPIKFGDPIGLGMIPSLVLTTFAEFFCSLLIVVGLYTRLATIPLMITMAVAAFVVHIDDPFPKMEFPILYLVIFLTLLLTGPGAFSLDARFRKQI